MKIIAIGGPHGSGKSSVARKLAKELGMNYISAGEIFRQMAKERKLSLEQFSEIVLNEPEIDREIDKRTQIEGSKDNTLVDAQLAIYFTSKETALKICITASPQIRWERIAKRENIDIEAAKEETEIREKSERQRYLSLYDIDVNDLSKYDIIINSDRLDETQTYELTLLIAKYKLNFEN